MAPRDRRTGLVLALTGLAALAVGCGSGDEAPVSGGTTPPALTPATTPATTSGGTSPGGTSPGDPSAGSPTEPVGTPAEGGEPRVLETVASDLEVPWGLDFFSNGDAIVTERDSRRVLRISGPDRQVTVLGTVDAAAPEGEAGLLGVALSPTFDQDRLVFLYVTTAEDNRVVRATLDGDRLGEPEPLLTGIPNGFIHDGGRLEFGPDGYLYVSTGEVGEPERAQDRDDLGGKILRITTDGEPAPGNPFDSPVWSYGHRNVQGLAFVGDQLWASEFGANRFDELNRVEAGANFGWPEVEGTGGTDAGYVDPQATWDTAEASPSGLAHAEGHLWLAALRGERLWRVPVDGERAGTPRAFFVGDHGRMRTVALAPDGTLWVTTSNRDGRGDPAADDDRILRIQP